MRRRKWLIAAVIPTCVLIGGILLWKPIRADMGIYIEAGEPIVVFHGGFREPIVMRSTAGNHDMFKKLRTGDKILVFHNGCMMLSYPAQLNVSFCISLKKGDVSDVPEGVLESLEEMGFIRGGSFGKNQ